MEETVKVIQKVPLKKTKGTRKPYIDMLINGKKDTMVDIVLVGNATWVGKSLHGKQEHTFSFNPYCCTSGEKYSMNGINYEIL
jgi:hypothetical protein